MGATPDMLVECDCCGKGLLEVKCPWTVKDGHLADLLCKSDSCLIECNDDLKLKTTHRYYYQIQLQQVVWQREYCDCAVEPQ